ncbi:MAG: hypothetical protein AUG51_03900 [Acidobacteria bacterium 13_1_20CM_3_53_8]|nr:MAG: hypothetical protein AUG51_03900 [Acidobacteria bacterium 13_1_20CM_3_53_8]
MRQPTLFESRKGRNASDAEEVALYALGDFQARGKVLAGRDLPLDRLRGALKRASDSFGVEELSDEQAVRAFQSLGAEVRRVPPFVAKHPFRVTVSEDLAQQALEAFRKRNAQEE